MTPLLLAVSLLLAAPVPKDFKKDAPRPPDGAWRLTADQTDDIILVVEKMTRELSCSQTSRPCIQTA